MSLISEWTETARNVLTNPADFFRTEMRRDGFGYPLRFALVSLVLASIIRAIGALIFSSMGSGALDAGLAAAVSTLIGGPIFGIIGLFIGAAVVHIFVYILGGEHRYSQTFAVGAYTTALTPVAAVLGIIPVIGGIASFVLSLYGLYIHIKGIEVFQEMSIGRAAAAVLLPAIILFLIVFALVVLAASFFAIGNLATGPA